LSSGSDEAPAWLTLTEAPAWLTAPVDLDSSPCAIHSADWTMLSFPDPLRSFPDTPEPRRDGVLPEPPPNDDPRSITWLLSGDVSSLSWLPTNCDSRSYPRAGGVRRSCSRTRSDDSRSVCGESLPPDLELRRPLLAPRSYGDLPTPALPRTVLFALSSSSIASNAPAASPAMVKSIKRLSQGR